MRIRVWVGMLGLAAMGALGLAPGTRGQESPYIVTYDHYLEEPGNLEVEYFSTFGTQHGIGSRLAGLGLPGRSGNDFHAFWVDLGYGATTWWTTEFYVDGQSTFGDSTVFTGVRWENRFRPMRKEHIVNPVLYVEYGRVSGADKILKEIEGHDVAADQALPNALLRREVKNELELKLILSSTWKGWNFAQNTIAAKNLSNAPWEFGYTMGMSRALKLGTPGKRCALCAESFIAGVEMYGGLGDRHSFGLRETSHYVAPAVAWNLPSGWSMRLSPGFGLNDNSHGFLLRWGVSYEFNGVGERVRQWLGRR